MRECVLRPWVYEVNGGGTIGMTRRQWGPLADKASGNDAPTVGERPLQSLAGNSVRGAVTAFTQQMGTLRAPGLAKLGGYRTTVMARWSLNCQQVR